MLFVAESKMLNVGVGEPVSVFPYISDIIVGRVISTCNLLEGLLATKNVVPTQPSTPKPPQIPKQSQKPLKLPSILRRPHIPQALKPNTPNP